MDFRETIAELDHAQQSRVIGRSNLTLIEEGVVKWSDVVTSNRVRDFREVVARQKLGVKAMVAAGVSPRLATEAYATVHTPAHELAATHRQDLLDKLLAKGVQKDQLRRALAERLAARVGIDRGPSGPGALPVAPTTPRPPRGGTGGARLPAAAARHWIPSEGAILHGDVTVMADVRKIDRVLRRDSDYVGPGGTGAAVAGRYAGAMAFLATGKPVDQPRMAIGVDGTISVRDGRHRFAAVRDEGTRTIPVSVPEEDAAEFRRLYGARPAWRAAARRGRLPGPLPILQAYLISLGVSPEVAMTIARKMEGGRSTAGATH